MGSPSSSETMRLALPAEAASVTDGRHAARSFLEGRGVDIDAVITVVGELLANAVSHGYRKGAEGTMTLELRHSPAAVTVSVADGGVGMRPNVLGGGLGLGLAIAAALAERIEIETSAAGGTLVRARFPDG
jgi:anti-sigma regulatory factor (Ser/Thr protein kinase)